MKYSNDVIVEVQDQRLAQRVRLYFQMKSQDFMTRATVSDCLDRVDETCRFVIMEPCPPDAYFGGG